MAKTTTKDPKYKVVFQIGKDTYKGSGATLVAALKKIKPKNFIGFGTIRVTVDGKESKLPVRLVPVKLERLFSKDIELRLFAKRIETLI